MTGDQSGGRENVWDTGYEADAESAYECFQCGTHVYANGSPMACPECGGELRNRDMPIE